MGLLNPPQSPDVQRRVSCQHPRVPGRCLQGTWGSAATGVPAIGAGGERGEAVCQENPITRAIGRD